MARTHSLAYGGARLFYGDQFPRIERVRIADVSREAAEAAAARLDWQSATADWRDITRAQDIDLVDIVTPNHLHAEIAIDAARHGKHVLCEKPLAPTPDAALAMYREVRDAGVVNQVGFVFRKWPAMTLARRLVDEGRLGRILRFRAHYFHDYALDPSFEASWRLQRATAGAGSIGDIGSHLIDLARYLVGDVARVLARSRTIYAHRPAAGSTEPMSIDVDDATDVLFEFVDGASGVIETSWMAAGYKTDLSFEISGDEGAIRFTWCRNGELEFYSHQDGEDRRGFRTIIIGPMHEGAEGFWPVPGQGLGYGDAFTILIGDLLGAIRNGAAVTPSFLDGLRTAAVVEAVLRSVETGSWVDVDLGRP